MTMEIEIYEYFEEFIIFYTLIDAWYIFVSIRHETFESYSHGWCLQNVGVKKIHSSNYIKIIYFYY
jgi:hypothetical protein